MAGAGESPPLSLRISGHDTQFHTRQGRIRPGHGSIVGLAGGRVKPKVARIKRAGTNVGQNVGTTAGTKAGTNVGQNVGTTAGMKAGTNAGQNVGTTAGMKAGTNAGMTASTIAGGTAPHPTPFPRK